MTDQWWPQKSKVQPNYHENNQKLIPELLEIIERKLKPSPSEKFKSQLTEVISCIMSGGVSSKDSNEYMLK